MKQIELTDEQYEALLNFKNYISTKVGTITNKEVIDKLQPSFVNEKDKKCVVVMPNEIAKNYDFEPEYTFGKCIAEMARAVMTEQMTGEVIYIT